MRDDRSRQHGGRLILRVVAQEQAGELAILHHGQREAVGLRTDDADGLIDEEQAGLKEVAGGEHLVDLDLRGDEVAHATQLPDFQLVADARIGIDDQRLEAGEEIVGGHGWLEDCEVGLVVHRLHLRGQLPAGVSLFELDVSGVRHQLAGDEDLILVQEHPESAAASGRRLLPGDAVVP